MAGSFNVADIITLTSSGFWLIEVHLYQDSGQVDLDPSMALTALQLPYVTISPSAPGNTLDSYMMIPPSTPASINHNYMWIYEAVGEDDAFSFNVTGDGTATAELTGSIDFFLEVIATKLWDAAA